MSTSHNGSLAHRSRHELQSQCSPARRRALARRIGACFATLQFLAVGSTVLEAQGLPIKSALAASGVSGCAAFPPPAQAINATPNADAESRRLIDDAQDAALQGDHGAARDAFAKAALLVPGNARVAYYLGRELEALVEATLAVREYCRYLALSPAAPDADEVRGRIVRLTPASDLARVSEAQANFRSGVALLQRKQYLAADSTFGTVARQVPSAPEPYFNRALSRAARGDRTAAMQDFEKYLELAPQASDRPELRGSMARLQDRVYGPGQAFGSGVIISRARPNEHRSTSARSIDVGRGGWSDRGGTRHEAGNGRRIVHRSIRKRLQRFLAAQHATDGDRRAGGSGGPLVGRRVGVVELRSPLSPTRGVDHREGERRAGVAASHGGAVAEAASGCRSLCPAWRRGAVGERQKTRRREGLGSIRLSIGPKCADHFRGPAHFV